MYRSVDLEDLFSSVVERELHKCQPGASQPAGGGHGGSRGGVPDRDMSAEVLVAINDTIESIKRVLHI